MQLLVENILILKAFLVIKKGILMICSKYIFLTSLVFASQCAFADAARSSVYSPGAAVTYANKWSSSTKKLRNPAYPDIPDSDCTNFVSQVLQAGGWNNTRSKIATATADWYAVGSKENQVSYTWRAVSGLRGRLIQGYEKTATSVSSYSKLKAGDIVFIDFQGDGQYDHAVVVTGFKSGDPVLAYHSNDTNGIKFFDFKEKIRSKMKLPLNKVKYTYISIS